MAWQVTWHGFSYLIESDVARELMVESNEAWKRGDLEHALKLKLKAIHIENSKMAAEGTLEGDYR